MDFWTRLIGGGGQKQFEKNPSQDPQQRLQRFKRTYNSFLQICNRPQSLASHGSAVDSLYGSLQRLTTIIKEESRAPAPHVCLSFAASSQIYSVVARAASASQDERIIREAITLFGALVDSQEEEFLGSAAFAKALMRFVSRTVDSGSVIIDAETETDIVEVLFGVTAKIRLQPEILPVWFTTRSEQDSTPVKEKKSFVGTTQKEDFPLCYLLIDRIHHEGRIGDFARTGLLYIFESVSHSPNLEEWIVGSDLPTLMASGLGALYSQLSRELSVLQDPEKLPLILALSDYVDLHKPSTAESVQSESHIGHMTTFLSHLAFWQDVLEHCKSPDVKQTLIDHFQILFLQQLLYPSLLQSSDTDGGSSVAVLTYLTNMLESLDHPDLIRMILHYLLAIPEGPSSRPGMPPRSPTALKRRTSLMLLTAPQNEDDRFEPVLFNLVDLILNGIQSKNAQTAFSALKLSSVILDRHRNYALTTLLRVDKSSSHDFRTVGALCAEMDSFVQAAVQMGNEDGMNETYTAACHDVRSVLELQLVRERIQSNGADLTPSTPSMKPTPGLIQDSFRLSSDDAFVRSITDLVKSFLSNSVDVNLALTETIMSLATSSNIALDGWLTLLPCRQRPLNIAGGDSEDGALSMPTFDGMDEDEIAALRKLYSTLQRPTWDTRYNPILLASLESLVEQLGTLRTMFATFDELLAKRKEILRGSSLTSEPQALPDVSDLLSDAFKSPRLTPVPQRLQPNSQISSRNNSRNVSPARSATSRRSRQSVDLSAGRSTLSPLPSSRRNMVSPARLSTSIFQPPPPDAPDSPRPTLTTRTSSRTNGNEAELLKRKVRFPLTIAADMVTGSNGEEGKGGGDAEERKEVSLSHVLTNAVVLQEFVLELVAVMQTRAVLLGEVRFQ